MSRPHLGTSYGRRPASLALPHASTPRRAAARRDPGPAGAPRLPADAEALHALDPHVWPRNAARADGDGLSSAPSRSPASTSATSPPSTAPRCSSSTRPTSASRCRGLPRGVRRRRRAADVFYAGKAFLCTARGPLGRRGGPRPRRLHRRRARRRAARRLPRRADRLARQQQVASPSSSRALEAGVGRYRRRLVRGDRAARRPRPSAPRRRRRRPGPRHRRRRGAHPRVHRHRPRGPEVRPLAGRRRGRGGRAPRRSSCRRLRLVGLHCHIGSQIFDTAGFEVAAHRRRRRWPPRSATSTGVEVAELDLGGGLGIAYTARRRPADGRGDGRPAARRSSASECAAAASPSRGSRSSRAARSSGPAPSRSTRSARSRTSTSAPGHARALRQRRRRDERQHPHRALRRGVHRARWRRACRDAAAGAAPRRRQALRERRHRRARLLAARRPRARRPARRRRDRRLLPGDGLATTTTCRARRSSRSATGEAALVLRRETVDDLLALDAGSDRAGCVEPDRAGTLARTRRGGRYPDAGPGGRWASTSRRDSMTTPDAAPAELTVALLGGGAVGSQVVRLLRESADDLAARVGAPLRAGRRRRPRRRATPATASTPPCSPTTSPRSSRRGDVDVVVEVHRRHRAGPLADPRRDGGRRRRSSPPTRRCSPRTARRCTRPPRSTASTSTTRPPSPARSRCCARCASRSPATRSAACSASSTAPPTSSSPRWTRTAPTTPTRSPRRRRLGYAEADPTADVEGYDAAAKAAILAGLAFHTRVTVDDVLPRGHHRR